jgi:23S rRNA pseudouridine2457 synthase
MPHAFQYYIIYKPYGYLSKFTPEHKHKTLADFYDFPKNVYPIGRLDVDSEGLLLITDDKKLNHALLNPLKRHERTYWVQVDGAIHQEAIDQLENGVTISIEGVKYKTLPAKAKIIETPEILEPRIPPVRFRKNIPTTWIELKLVEGKNRQVRRMTAGVGFPTLRLVRSAIQNIHITQLNWEKTPNGKLIKLNQKEVYDLLQISHF